MKWRPRFHEGDRLMVAAAVSLGLMLAGCAAGPLSLPSDDAAPSTRDAAADRPGPTDLAREGDGTRAPDLAPPDLADRCAPHELANPTCDDLAGWAFDWIQCHRACHSDADCVYIQATPPPCNMECEYSVDRSFSGAYFNALVTRFADNCQRTGCYCSGTGYPACIDGICASN